MGKRLREVIVLLLLFLTGVSLTSGLELSASTGNDGDGSSMHVAYGATIEDYNNEHIGVSPADGTIYNAFSGTGSLPFQSLYNFDNKGNWASVSRSVSGKPGITTFKSDWGRQYPVSTIGSGIGAWVSLTAGHAYSINGRGCASNSQGDVVDTSIAVESPDATASLTNYYANPMAFTNGVSVSQKGDTANAYSITAKSSAKNKEGDYSNTLATISSPVSGQASVNTFSNLATADLGYVEANQISYKASSYGDKGTLRFFAQSGDLQGDFSDVGTYPDIGVISNLAQTTFAKKYSAESSGKFDKVVSNYLNTWSWASNKEGDVSYTQAFVNRNRLFQNYATTATAGRTSVYSNIKAGYIGTSAGGSIKLMDKSYNKNVGDWAHASDWAQAYTVIEPTLISPQASASAWTIDESSQASKSYSGANIKSLSASSDSGNLFQELFGKNAFNDYSWSRIDYPNGGSIYSIPYKSTGSAYADAHSDYSRYTDAHLSDKHAGQHQNWAYAVAYNGQNKNYYYPNYRYNCWSADAYTSGTRTISATVTPLG